MSSNFSGICKNCNKKLDKLALSQDEFNDLRKYFLEKVIIGKNIFCKTNPLELEAFKQFLDGISNYDVVIDGLNVAYAAGVKQSPRTLGFMVRE